MNLSCAPASNQLQLLSVPPSYNLNANSHCRNSYGHLAQEIVCAALQLSPIPINGNFDCCFDAESDNGTKCEIKSVRRTGKVVLYHWRVQKEAAWITESKGVLQYHILIHNMVKGNATGATLYHDYPASGLWLASMDAQKIHALSVNYKLTIPKPGPLNKPRHGYNRKGYCDGYYNIPVYDITWLLTNVKKKEFVFHNRTFEIIHFT